MPTINPCGDPPTGHACSACGIWVFSGIVHYCGVLPNPFPGAQPTPGCRAPWVPLTADAVRLIVREELERALKRTADDSTGEPTK